MKKIIANQKGFTLVELLASLAIFSIIAGLVSGVLLNSMNYYDMSKNKISLSRESNLILTQLTRLHQTEPTYTISYNNTTKQLLVDGESISSADLDIKVLSGGQQGYETISEGQLQVLNMEVTTDKPLYLELFLQERGKTQLSYSVKTVINRKQ